MSRTGLQVVPALPATTAQAEIDRTLSASLASLAAAQATFGEHLAAVAEALQVTQRVARERDYLLTHFPLYPHEHTDLRDCIRQTAQVVAKARGVSVRKVTADMHRLLQERYGVTRTLYLPHVAFPEAKRFVLEGYGAHEKTVQALSAGAFEAWLLRTGFGSTHAHRLCDCLEEAAAALGRPISNMVLVRRKDVVPSSRYAVRLFREFAAEVSHEPVAAEPV